MSQAIGKIITAHWKDTTPVGVTRIFVARFRPRFLRREDEPWKEWAKDLAPSAELHREGHGREFRSALTLEWYLDKYREEMKAERSFCAISMLAARVLMGESLALLCHCKDPGSCHRTTLKYLIEDRIEEARDQVCRMIS